MAGRGAWVVVTILSLVLSACGTRRGLELPEMDDWESRTAILAALRDWEFRGRIGVTAGDDGFNGKLRWMQDRKRFRATVSGPLGIGTVKLEGDERSVELTDKDGVRTVMHDAETELYLRYGWTIPLESLRYWALGIPDPGLPADTVFDEQGRLASLDQGAWNVRITRYGKGGGQAMPDRLMATNNGTKVRIVIDRWSFFDRPKR